MTNKVTTVDLLEFITKAQKVSPDVNVRKVDDGYNISIYCDWDDNDDFYTKSTFISNKGKSEVLRLNSIEFYTMSCLIDYEIEKEEERENKQQRRQELLSRLSDEEKELLGVS